MSRRPLTFVQRRVERESSRQLSGCARAVATMSGIAALSLFAAACAGQAGGAAAENAGGGAGVPVGASAEEYQEALADMEQVTLNVQTSAQSDTGYLSDIWLNFKESVEELSGGKIQIKLIHAQAIAGYPEIEDALNDGRLDIAYHIPHYDPANSPVHSAFISANSVLGASPRADELAANAAIMEVGWDTPALVEEFEAKGLHPLQLSIAQGTVMNMCTAPGATAEDWDGSQVRTPASAHQSQVQALGGNPVSLDYLETYEALQRNTIDCSIGASLTAVVGGILEVTPYVQFTDAASFARPNSSVSGGAGYAKLPLAGQQLIFDQMGNVFRDWRYSDLEGNAVAAKAVRDEGGSYEKLAPDLEKILIANSEDVIDGHIDDGLLDESVKTELPKAMEKWRGVVEDMGYSDEGSFEDMDQWHDRDEIDLQPFSDKVFEEVFVPHRPS